MEIPVRVRPATQADIPALLELLGFLFAQEAEFTPETERQQRGLGMILADEKVGRILVLDAGQDSTSPHLLGMVNLLYVPSTALGQRVAILEDMVIHPDQRGRGFGTQLLQAALTFAEREGLARLTLLTDGDNAAAQRFYARHGFSKSSMLPMRRVLTDGAPDRTGP